MMRNVFSLEFFWEFSKGLMMAQLFHYTFRGMKEATIDNFPYHGSFLNEILMIGSVDIFIMLGYDDGFFQL